jgi:hypothetical protein
LSWANDRRSDGTGLSSALKARDGNCNRRRMKWTEVSHAFEPVLGWVFAWCLFGIRSVPSVHTLLACSRQEENNAELGPNRCLVNAVGLGYTPAMRTMMLLVICLAGASAWAQSKPSPPASSQATSVQAQSPSTSDEIIADEQRFWDLVVAGNFDGMGTMLSPDFVSVSSKILERAAFIEDVRSSSQTCPLQPVHVNNPQVTNVSPDVATIAYSAILATSCKGRDVKLTSSTISIWVRRDGVWRVHLRTQLLANGFVVQSH